MTLSTATRVDRIILDTIQTRNDIADFQLEMVRKIVNYIDHNERLLVDIAAIAGFSADDWANLVKTLNVKL